jgi:hypothetical protein
MVRVPSSIDPPLTLTSPVPWKQSQQGIQTLLEAEKEAAKIVAKARQCESNTIRNTFARTKKTHEIPHDRPSSKTQGC